MEKQLGNIQDHQITKDYLLTLLNQDQEKDLNNMNELIEYIAGLEDQFNEILNELQEVKQQLSQVQNPTIKMRLNETFIKSETFIHDGKVKIENTKSQMIDLMREYMNDFKQKGKIGIVKAIDITQLKRGLEGIKKSLFCSLKQIQKVSSTIDSMTSQLRKSKTRMKNIGRLFMGKPIQDNSYDINKLNIMQRGCRNIFFRLERAAIKTTRFLHRIEDFEKSSVKKDIKKLTHQSKHNHKQNIEKGQSR